MQSLGAPEDAELRAWIDRGEIPGPRLLSSLGAVREDTGTPDEIRAYVRDRAAAGADVIKVFASTSIRFGGVTNLSAAQLEAACGEARAQGLRSVVHLHRSDALRLVADAGCTQVEHGWMLEPGDVDVFVESGMYLGNQIDLLFRNYEERGDRYAGVGGYTLEGFANLQASRPGALAFFRSRTARSAATESRGKSICVAKTSTLENNKPSNSYIWTYGNTLFSSQPAPTCSPVFSRRCVSRASTLLSQPAPTCSPVFSRRCVSRASTLLSPFRWNP